MMRGIADLTIIDPCDATELKQVVRAVADIPGTVYVRLLRGNVAEVETALGYFVNNVSRMQYGTFRAKKYFIGSGVIEAGCRTIIGKRCKQSGMFWGEPGAEKILAFRCIHASHRLDSFWKHRLNSRVAQNDSLPLAA